MGLQDKFQGGRMVGWSVEHSDNRANSVQLGWYKTELAKNIQFCCDYPIELKQLNCRIGIRP